MTAMERHEKIWRLSAGTIISLWLIGWPIAYLLGAMPWRIDKTPTLAWWYFLFPSFALLSTIAVVIVGAGVLCVINELIVKPLKTPTKRKKKKNKSDALQKRIDELERELGINKGDV